MKHFLQIFSKTGFCSKLSSCITADKSGKGRPSEKSISLTHKDKKLRAYN